MSIINDDDVKSPLLAPTGGGGDEDVVAVRGVEFVPTSKFERWNEDRLFGANGRVLRYLALFFICVLTFGSYYVYDTPGAIQNSLESYYDITDSQYALLYSVYSWPNTIIVFFGGYLVDRFGVRLCCLIFSSLVLAGQVLFAFSAIKHSFAFAIVGRVVFGLGGESLGVSQSAFTARWFKGKELAMAFGIALSFARIGSALNLNVTPYIVEKGGVQAGLWVGVFCCVFSLVGAILLSLMDKYAEKRRKVKASGVDDPPPKLTDVKDFPLTLWLVFFICVTFYIAVFIMIQFGSVLVQHRFGVSQQVAGSVVSVPYLVSACASPFLGFAVDRIGRSVMWVAFATWLLMVAHMSFFFLPPYPYFAWPQFIMIGVAYSVCAAALWPSVALIVPQAKLGTAYGLMNAIQNLGIALGSLGGGYLLEATNQDYHMLTFSFGCMAGISCLLTMALFYVDLNSGQTLNASATQLKMRAAVQKLREEAADNAALAAAAANTSDTAK